MKGPGGRVALAALVVALLAGCSALGAPPAASTGETDGNAVSPVPVESWSFSDDRRSVTVTFMGGPDFAADDLCSIDYQGTAAIDDGELDISVTAARPRGTPPEGVACPALSVPRTLTLNLPEPFDGTRIHDLAGQLFFLKPPPGLVDITGLPVGWLQRSSTSLKGSPTGSWQRVYSPLSIPGPDDRQVRLIQTFGAPADVTGGELQPDVTVNGATATFYFSEPRGEMVLDWQIGTDGIALVGDLRDFTQQAFIALAESVQPPTS